MRRAALRLVLWCIALASAPVTVPVWIVRRARERNRVMQVREGAAIAEEAARRRRSFRCVCGERRCSK